LFAGLGAAAGTPTLQAQEQDGAPKVLVATRAEQAPRIDGILDDPVWQNTPAREDFVQSFPKLGAAPGQRTALHVAFDDANLYFAVLCADPDPGSIEPLLSRRDRYVNTDEVEIDIDTYGDRRTALRFTLSVAGVQRDAAIYNDGEYDPEWDGVWEGSSHLTDSGWSAEIRIPFSQMPVGRARENGFGLQVRRRRRLSNESSEWVYVPPWQSGEVSRYGRLEGLSGIQPGSHLELLPFAAARRRTPAPDESFLGDSGLGGDAGLDLRYRPLPNSTLNATFNPDFGQVELDQVVLNLTTFETFYPEKRPFFTEGSGFFSTPFRLFYSRRIGQRPAGPPLAPGDEVLHEPVESTILGAAKWTGRTGRGLTYGALEAVTQTERARVRHTGGQISEEVAAPHSSYSVLRIKQDFLENSSLGMIGTLNDHTDGRQATAGGLDWSLRLLDRQYRFEGQVIGTRVAEDGRSDGGNGGLFSFAREGGLHWRWDLSHTWLSPDAEYNDLGFMGRPDLRSDSASLVYREDRPGQRLQDYRLALGGSASHNYAGAAFDRFATLDADLQFINFWSLSASVIHQFAIFDDRETRGGPLYRIPSQDTGRLSISSDPRHLWQGGFGIDIGEEYDGNLWSADASSSWRMGRHFELQASTTYARSSRWKRWVETVSDALGPHYIFGDQDQREVDFNLEGVLAVTPELSVQARAQVFAATVNYSSFVELTQPDRLEITPAALGLTLQPDVRTANFNGQVVLRWQYRPGSFLTFVLTRRLGLDDGRAGESFARTLGDLSGLEGETVALLKISYWWNP
jgi:hypothetical protein